MAISKVKSIGTITKSEHPKFGVTYYHRVTMENGDTGSLGKKIENGVKVGEELDYTLEVNDKGNKIVLNKKEFAGKGFSAPSTDAQILMAAAYLTNIPGTWSREEKITETKAIFKELKQFLSEQK